MIVIRNTQGDESARLDDGVVEIRASDGKLIAVVIANDRNTQILQPGDEALTGYAKMFNLSIREITANLS